MVITLCGSLRYRALFVDWHKKLAECGHSVFTIAGLNDGQQTHDDAGKQIADMVYFKNIINSDGILVLNKDGYMGYSTRREVAWAIMNEKSVFWLQSVNLALPEYALNDAYDLLMWSPRTLMNGVN